MNKLLLFAFVLSTVCFSQTTSAKKNQKPILTERVRIFEPGLVVGNEKVKKVFNPSFVVSEEGSLLAFCQGRLRKGGDNELKVILMRRSPDLGKTWEDVQVLSNPINHFAVAPYKSTVNGKNRISFLTCIGLTVTKQFYQTSEKLKSETGIDLDIIGDKTAGVIVRYYSDDDGKTWKHEYLFGNKSPLCNIHNNGRKTVFTNLIGQVTEIKKGKYTGRYILSAPLRVVSEGEDTPSNFRDIKCAGTSVIYSDDKGETWLNGGGIFDYSAGESATAVLNNGKDLIMIRRYNGNKRMERRKIKPSIDPKQKRIAHTSKDGGITWSDPYLIDVSRHTCHGGIVNVNNCLFLSMPARTLAENKGKREYKRSQGTIYYSDNDGVTWRSKLIEPKFFSYSNIDQLDKDRMIVMYTEGYHGEIGVSYRIFNLEWLKN